MTFMRLTLLIGTVFLGALAVVAALGGAQGFGACQLARSANPPVAATARASTAADGANAPVKAVVEDEPAVGLRVRDAAQAKRALALAILLGGNADHD
jgi:hypothetical protein